jgi:hypothetical protein
VTSHAQLRATQRRRAIPNVTLRRAE